MVLKLTKLIILCHNFFVYQLIQGLQIPNCYLDKLSTDQITQIFYPRFSKTLNRPRLKHNRTLITQTPDLIFQTYLIPRSLLNLGF